MNYLNPNLDEVQDTEVIAAAKLIHWTSKSAAARAAQVSQMIDVFKSFMSAADRRVGIDGRPASQCCVIADILHQGRGGRGTTWPQIDRALKSSRPYEALIAIGAPKWNGRKRKLKNAIDAMAEMSLRRWSRAQSDFV
jgi:hypothetical protein